MTPKTPDGREATHKDLFGSPEPNVVNLFGGQNSNSPRAMPRATPATMKLEQTLIAKRKKDISSKEEQVRELQVQKKNMEVQLSAIEEERRLYDSQWTIAEKDFDEQEKKLLDERDRKIEAETAKIHEEYDYKLDDIYTNLEQHQENYKDLKTRGKVAKREKVKDIVNVGTQLDHVTESIGVLKAELRDLEQELQDRRDGIVRYAVKESVTDRIARVTPDGTDLKDIDFATLKKEMRLDNEDDIAKSNGWMKKHMVRFIRACKDGRIAKNESAIRAWKRMDAEKVDRLDTEAKRKFGDPTAPGFEPELLATKVGRDEMVARMAVYFDLDAPAVKDSEDSDGDY